MKSTNNKGFTLVELIIVITILSILATIAFISFQNYSSEARDSKVKAELNNAIKFITAEQAKGSPVDIYIDTNYAGSKLATVSVQGAAPETYIAGRLNKTLLGLESENEYAMGYVNNFGGSYQLAGRLQAGGDFAYVTGNYNPRKSESLSCSSASGSTTLTIDSSSIGKLKVGDTLAGIGIQTGTKINKISSDLKTITLSHTTSNDVTSVKLAEDETDGLIKNVDGGPTVNGGSWPKLD